MTVQAVRTQIDFNVPAGERQSWSVDAETLRCLEASQAFTLSIDRGEPVAMDRGLGHEFAPNRFKHVTIIAPIGSSITGRIVVGDGTVQDGRVTISAAAGLSVNVIKVTGPPLEALNNTLTVSGGLTPSRAIIAALNTNIEWVMVQNRGATQLALSNADGEIDAAIILDPGEREKVTSGGPLWITNKSAVNEGAYSALYGERA